MRTEGVGPGWKFRTEMAQSTRILIVAAREDERSAMLEALQRQAFEIVDAPDLTEAYASLLDSHFDLIVIETAGPARDGIEFIKRVRATPQLTGILILIMAEWGTGEPTLALAAGADAYEPVAAKPIDSRRIITSIERLLSRQAAAAN